MKKFLTILALLAVALNFSSVQLWAEDMNAAVPAETTTVLDQDNGISVENTEAVVQESNSEEKKSDGSAPVVESTTSTPAVTEEVKKEEEKTSDDVNAVVSEEAPAVATVS